MIWGSGSQLKIILNLFFKNNNLDNELIYIFDPFIKEEDQKFRFNYDEKWLFSSKDLELLPKQDFYVAIGNEYGYERYCYTRKLTI